MHLLVNKTEALQQIFLEVAASEAAANAAVNSPAPPGEDESQQQDQPEGEEGGNAAKYFEEESQHQSETQEGDGVDEEQGDPEPEIEEEPYSPKPAWSVAVMSFRGALKALQEKRVLGGKVTAEQALAAFHQACYEGCTSDQLPGHTG